MPMNCAQVEPTRRENARLVPVEPHVKSAKMRELFNADAGTPEQTAKSADPTCYNSPTVDLTGLFENVERDMERAVALKKLGNILGKKLGWRVDPRAPRKEEREAAKADLGPACELRNKLKDKRDARYAAILAADPEYQSLKAAYSDAQKVVDRISSLTRHHKITVGTSEGMFFLVKAEGDSWEEVIAKLQTKQDA